MNVGFNTNNLVEINAFNSLVISLLKDMNNNMFKR